MNVSRSGLGSCAVSGSQFPGHDAPDRLDDRIGPALGYAVYFELGAETVGFVALHPPAVLDAPDRLRTSGFILGHREARHLYS